MPGAIDQCELVGTRGVVLDVWLTIFICLDLCDHRMTEAKGLEEALENGVVFMFIVTDVLVVLFILKVNVGDA